MLDNPAIASVTFRTAVEVVCGGHVCRGKVVAQVLERLRPSCAAQRVHGWARCLPSVLCFRPQVLMRCPEELCSSPGHMFSIPQFERPVLGGGGQAEYRLDRRRSTRIQYLLRGERLDPKNGSKLKMKVCSKASFVVNVLSIILQKMHDDFAEDPP